MGIDQRAPDVCPAQGVLLEKVVTFANKFACGRLVFGLQCVEGLLGDLGRSDTVYRDMRMS